jgi:ABC-type amino acid transport system permease subunit
VVFTLFTGAYMAEIVRGGLQSVPRGQFEAARALGLSPPRQTFLVVLPQALRNVIPAQIGQLISPVQGHGPGGSWRWACSNCSTCRGRSRPG